VYHAELKSHRKYKKLNYRRETARSWLIMTEADQRQAQGHTNRRVNENEALHMPIDMPPHGWRRSVYLK